MQRSHTVYTRPPLFILLWSAYCSIKPAILLLRNKRKLIKHCSKSAPFFVRLAVRKISLPSEEPLSMAHSKTCIPFHYKQEIHSSRKTPCRGYTLSIIALTSAAHNESLKCERLKMQKDRRRPDTCHPFHPEVLAPHTNTQYSLS